MPASWKSELAADKRRCPWRSADSLSTASNQAPKWLPSPAPNWRISPNVKVNCVSFEAFSCQPATYDLLLSATAFHWIDPRIRFQKAHELLKASGALAVFWHRPVQTETSRHIFRAVQQIYRAVAPELTSDYVAPPPPAEVATEYEALIPGSGYFDDLEIRRHYVATKYAARAYIELLGTFSDHQTLNESKRQRLFSDIESLINDAFAGTVIRETVALLYLARRR